MLGGLGVKRYEITLKATPTATCPKRVNPPPAAAVFHKAKAPAPGPANISGTKPYASGLSFIFAATPSKN